jgi:hypothetical protein
MVLAMHQWKPEVSSIRDTFASKSICSHSNVRITLHQINPKHLAITKFQTVARLRNKICRRLTRGELAIYKYQHTVDDLELFFIVTALLHGKKGQSEGPRQA